MTPFEPDGLPPDAATNPTLGRPDSLDMARLLRPLRVQMEKTAEGWELTLEPMLASAALAVLTELAPIPRGQILIWSNAAAAEPVPASARGLFAGEEGMAEGVILEAGRWSALDSLRLPTTLEAVVVDGEVEPSDAAAIIAARRAGRSAFSAELRATVAISVQDEGLLVVEARDQSDALTFAAEVLRQYLSGLRRVPVRAIARPDLELVDRLLDRTGFLQIRPIETEIFSTAVDIGVLTKREPQPADTSVIYDIFANTWHGD